MWPFSKRPRLFVVECARSILAEPSRWIRHLPGSLYCLTRDDGLDLKIYGGLAWFCSPVCPDLTKSEMKTLYKATASWPGNLSLSELVGLGEGDAK